MQHVRTIVGRLHVSASDREVIRAIRRAIARHHRTAPEHRAARKKAYRFGIKAHADNRDLFYKVARGLI